MAQTAAELQIDRVRRILARQTRGERSRHRRYIAAEQLTPQEVEMLTDLQAEGHQTDEYLVDAVEVARWVDAEF